MQIFNNYQSSSRIFQLPHPSSGAGPGSRETIPLGWQLLWPKYCLAPNHWQNQGVANSVAEGVRYIPNHNLQLLFCHRYRVLNFRLIRFSLEQYYFTHRKWLRNSTLEASHHRIHNLYVIILFDVQKYSIYKHIFGIQFICKLVIPIAKSQFHPFSLKQLNPFYVC